MFTSLTTKHRCQSAAVAALVAIGLTALPASARPDKGDPLDTTVVVDDEGACALARLGTQYVRCDNLTGNGVAAPAWVPER
jgi:hypothetical protein